MPATTAVKTEVLYAGFWWRLLAYLIDYTVIACVQAVLTVLVLVITASSADLLTLVNIAVVCSLIAWAYYSLLESSPARGTLGKIALNLFVADVHGDPITFYRASARYWLKLLSGWTFGVGWLLAAFTPRKQALHYLLSGTLVLRKRSYIVIGSEPPTEPGDYWDGTRWVASIGRSLKEA